MSLYMRSRRAWAVAHSRSLRQAPSGKGVPLLPWPSGLSVADAFLCSEWPRRSLQKYKRYGLPINRAEDLADAKGVHPTEWWPEYALLGDPLELAEEAA